MKMMMKEPLREAEFSLRQQLVSVPGTEKSAEIIKAECLLTRFLINIRILPSTNKRKRENMLSNFASQGISLHKITSRWIFLPTRAL